MFFPRSNPASPDPRRFAALRSSLNAPVVATDELPSGPARAAIVMWLESDGESLLEVRVRSVSTMRLVAYGFEGTLANAGEVDKALEAALNFAESMGFLFDDDILRGDDTIGREKVVEAWEAFESGMAPPRRSPAPEGGLAEITRPGVDDDALELTDLMVDEPGTPEAELNVELASGWDPDPVAEPAPPDPPDLRGRPDATLSKFRGEAEPARAPAKAAGKRTAVGRVPLVRRKAAGSRPGLLARILGAF